MQGISFGGSFHLRDKCLIGELLKSKRYLPRDRFWNHIEDNSLSIKSYSIPGFDLIEWGVFFLQIEGDLVGEGWRRRDSIKGGVILRGQCENITPSEENRAISETDCLKNRTLQSRRRLVGMGADWINNVGRGKYNAE